jgi:3-dehydroquinate synthase
LSIIYGIENLNNIIGEINPDKVFVLCDSNTKQYCLPKVSSFLKKEFELLTVPAGEEYKNIYTCQTIWSWLSDQNASAKSLVIIIGGGVLGDMGGFASSTFKRGLNFVLIPTTLLAMADASVGGKLAINFRNVKNEIGVFNNPASSIIDTCFLDTLPVVEALSGYAEIVKHALIADKTLWSDLKGHVPTEIIKNLGLVKRGISIKEKLVKKDPFDKADRRLLNFGHTIGHAFESVLLTHKKTIPHGFAVAAGMICEGFISFEKNKLSRAELDEITSHLLNNFDLKILKGVNPGELLQFVYKDKKNEESQILITLLNGIGDSSFNNNVSKETIITSVEFFDRLL